MQWCKLIAFVVLAAGSVGAAQPKERVTVYVENDANVPSPVLSRARTLAAEMFGGVGVRIEWRAGQRPDSQLLQERAIAVRLTLDTPDKFKSSVGAYAVPSEGVHVTVLYQHLAWSLAKPSLAPALLAHVLVHEIAHILEGIARHSVTGVMKANWTSSDYYEMQTKALPFTSEDIELIHSGLAQRKVQGGNGPAGDILRTHHHRRGHGAFDSTGHATAHRVGKWESCRARRANATGLRGVA